MRFLIVLPLLLFAACAPGPAVSTGTVYGHVLAAPCTPVERLDSPCPGLPVAGAILTFSQGSVHSTVTSDASGAYSVTLGPGYWMVDCDPRRPLSARSSTSVNVSEGAHLLLDFHIDSGIR